MRSLGLGIVIACCLLFSGLAQAEVIDGDNPAAISAVAVGSLGGLTASIAALVYTVQDRSFDSGWVILSLFSSAICGSFAMAIFVDMLETGGGEFSTVGVLSYLILAGWPLYFTVKSALNEAPPGSPFDAEVAKAPTLDPLLQRPGLEPVVGLSLPAIRF